MTKRFIAIAGNIGVGKSTLTRLLSERLGWEPFYEAVSDNPYLADFYQDMTRYAFHSQIFFLSRRLRHHRRLLDFNSVVQDRSVYEDAEIFARNLFEQCHILPRDYHTYRELYEVLIQFLPPPDLVVYLRASVPTLLDRISQRGRSFEQNIAGADGTRRRSGLRPQRRPPGPDYPENRGKAQRQRGSHLCLIAAGETFMSSAASPDLPWSDACRARGTRRRRVAPPGLCCEQGALPYAPLLDGCQPGMAAARTIRKRGVARAGCDARWQALLRIH